MIKGYTAYYGKGGKADSKGDGKNGAEGKGKGKGFQGVCYWCNKEGNTQARCHEKNSYMQQWVREQKGKGDIQSLEEHHDHHGCGGHVQGGAAKETLDNMEQQAQTGQTYRYIGSLETSNRYGALEVTDEHFQNLLQDLWPRRDMRRCRR